MTSGSPILDLIKMIERPNQHYLFTDSRGDQGAYDLLLQSSNGAYLSVCAVNALGTRVGWVNIPDVVLQTLGNEEDVINFFTDELLDALEDSIQHHVTLTLTAQ